VGVAGELSKTCPSSASVCYIPLGSQSAETPEVEW